MPVYRQILEMEDYQGSVIWEFCISSNYNELVKTAGETVEVKDVDIFDFESIKFDAEDNNLRQKEDELSFSMNEIKIKSIADTEAAALIKSSVSTDIWVALFEYEPENKDSVINYRNFESLLFSGLVRKKSTATDILWNGQQWSNAPNPVREWKYTAQSFGEAVLEKLVLASNKLPDGTIIKGLLDKLDIQPINAPIAYLPPCNDVEIKGIININKVFAELISKAQAQLQEKVPGIIIEMLPFQTGYKYSNYWNSTPDYHKHFSIQASKTINSEIYIDSRLINPEREADTVTPTSDNQLSWHRYATFTELLYKLAIFFGCALKIQLVAGNRLVISYTDVASMDTGICELIDVNNANIDIQTLAKSKEYNYTAQATAYCEEGVSYCYNTLTEILSPDKEIKNTQLNKGIDKGLPLSISYTTQYIVYVFPPAKNVVAQLQASGKQEKFVVLFQNCGEIGTRYSTFSMVWTGLLAAFTTNSIITPVTYVGGSVNGEYKWFNKITELLNNKVEANNDYFKTEYKITAPFIKAFRNINGSPTLKAASLFRKIVIDGKQYSIVGVEIKPTEGSVSLRLTNIEKYSNVPATNAPGGIPPGIAPPTNPVFKDNQSIVFDGIAGEETYANDLLMQRADGKYYRYKNISENYGRYCGIDETGTLTGEGISPKTTGKVSGLGLQPGQPIYARMNASNVCVPSAQRLTAKSAVEQIDICIGQAISPTEWELKQPIEFEIK